MGRCVSYCSDILLPSAKDIAERAAQRATPKGKQRKVEAWTILKVP
jgi:hypothetical protein